MSLDNWRSIASRSIKEIDAPICSRLLSVFVPIMVTVSIASVFSLPTAKRGKDSISKVNVFVGINDKSLLNMGLSI
jgi:hypothetical protein